MLCMYVLPGYGTCLRILMRNQPFSEQIQAMYVGRMEQNSVHVQ